MNREVERQVCIGPAALTTLATLVYAGVFGLGVVVGRSTAPAAAGPVVEGPSPQHARAIEEALYELATDRMRAVEVNRGWSAAEEPEPPLVLDRPAEGTIPSTVGGAD